MTRPLDLADELAALVNPLPQPGATPVRHHATCCLHASCPAHPLTPHLFPPPGTHTHPADIDPEAAGLGDDLLAPAALDPQLEALLGDTGGGAAAAAAAAGSGGAAGRRRGVAADIALEGGDYRCVQPGRWGAG
jgi:hypothetical protein